MRSSGGSRWRRGGYSGRDNAALPQARREGALAIDHPFAFAQWREISGEGFCMGELGMIAEELQLAGGISGGEFLQEQSSEQARQHAYREQKVRAARDPAVAVERESAARHDHVDVGMVGKR